MKNLTLGFVVSALFFLISLAWLGYTNTMPFSSSVTNFGGPATFPFLVLSVMTVGSGVVTAGEYWKMKRGGGELFPDMTTILRVAALFAVSVAYVAIVEVTTYVPATVALILASLLLFGVRRKVVLCAVSLAFPLSVYLLFQILLGVQLP